MVLPVRPADPYTVPAAWSEDVGRAYRNSDGTIDIYAAPGRIFTTGRLTGFKPVSYEMAPDGGPVRRLVEGVRVDGKSFPEPSVLTHADYGDIERRLVAQLVVSRETEIPTTECKPA